MASLADQIIETTEVRRHNGQCEYGEWMPLADAPVSVQEVVSDEIAEAFWGDTRREGATANTDESGAVECGGQRWVYRR